MSEFVGEVVWDGWLLVLNFDWCGEWSTSFEPLVSVAGFGGGGVVL